MQGLERIVPQTAQTEPAHWRAAVRRVADLLLRHQPRVIVCPHANDGHATHIGTHHLVMDALRLVGDAVRPHVLLTEYWNTQPDPGLMVELSAGDVAELVAALSLHAGEVARNPYHLTLPASCIDAVRRGSERVGVPGAATPGFSFATLYGWQRWTGDQSEPMVARFLPLDAPPGAFGCARGAGALEFTAVERGCAAGGHDAASSGNSGGAGRGSRSPSSPRRASPSMSWPPRRRARIRGRSRGRRSAAI